MKMSMLSQSIIVALSSVPESLNNFYRQNTISDEHSESYINAMVEKGFDEHQWMQDDE